MRGVVLFAALAIVPAMCGPMIARAAPLELTLCGGGNVVVPPGEGLPPPTGPCCSKGCHSQRQRAAKAAKVDA
jgi:hypothetical protein